MSGNGHTTDALAMAGSHIDEHPERPLGPPARKKLKSWDLYRSMGSPKYIVAVCRRRRVHRRADLMPFYHSQPMVDQSELVRDAVSMQHANSDISVYRHRPGESCPDCMVRTTPIRP